MNSYRPRRPSIFLCAAVCLTGCRKLPDAPLTLDELCGYLFEHANDDGDSGTLESGAINLDSWLDVNIAQTSAGYAVNTLTDDSVNALNDGDRSLDGVRGAAVGHTSMAQTVDLVSALVSTSPVEIQPDNFISSSRTFIGDKECFLDGECLSLEAETFSTIELALGIQADVHSMVQYRWVDTADFGRVAIERTWMREPATLNVDYLTVDQQYYVWMFIPNNGAPGSRSIQATWMVATLGSGSPPESAVLSIVVNTMTNEAENLDAWVLEG